MAQSLPPTEPFLLPCVCESANLGQSQPPHTIPPPRGPLSPRMFLNAFQLLLTALVEVSLFSPAFFCYPSF